MPRDIPGAFLSWVLGAEEKWNGFLGETESTCAVHSQRKSQDLVGASYFWIRRDELVPLYLG